MITDEWRGKFTEASRNIKKDFFKVIDTEEKAYWLGFIIADGNITRNTNRSSYRLVFTQKGEDIEHLEKFQRAIGSSFKIIEKIDNNPRYKNPLHQAKLRVSSRHIIQDLINLGITENKTGNEYLPEVDNHLKKHLIRGYIDGDGWIRKKRGLLGFVAGSYQVKDYISGYLKREIDVNFKCIDETRKYNSTVLNCNLNKKSESLKAIHFLYTDAKVYLDRKKKIVDEALLLNKYCPPIKQLIGNKPCEPVNTGCGHQTANGESPNVKSRIIPCQALYEQLTLF